MASYTRRPPSPRVLRALSFRSRRVGAVTRADVIAPPGLGDHGRVELQVTTICSH